MLWSKMAQKLEIAQTNKLAGTCDGAGELSQPVGTPGTLALGLAGEQRACLFLQDHGLTLIERNFRRKFGEIDLIMQDRLTLVFVEVRSRSQGRFGGAAASITRVKQRRMMLAAQAYLKRFSRLPPCRFDAVVIDAGRLAWLKDVIVAW